MKIQTILFTFLVLFLMSACSTEEIKQPPLQEPQNIQVQESSIIQVPISITTQEIREEVLKKLNIPLSSGISDKLSTKLISKFFDVSFQVRHKVFLKDLNLVFEGSKVKINSAYLLDLSVDYEQGFKPLHNKLKVKGLLDGKVAANIHVVGDISINDKAEIIIQIPKESTNVEFTKIHLPSMLDDFDILGLARVELFLSEKLLEKQITREIAKLIQKQITKKQVDIALESRIQKLASENSQAIKISNDLWLTPHLKKISLSQVHGENTHGSNRLTVKLGITAKPKLVTSSKQPKVKIPKKFPIALESFNPKIYLYPNIHLEYSYLENKIQKELHSLIKKEYNNSIYTISNIKIYPSDKKLVLGIDLIEKASSKKVFRFYLWGTPHLDTSSQTISLNQLEYTLESKNALLDIADWFFDEQIQNSLKETAIFNYKKQFITLSDKLVTIKRTTKNGVLQGGINEIYANSIFTSKDALVVNITAKGDLSYKLNLKTQDLP